MQTQTRFWSRLGVLGGVYAVLFVIANFLLGEPGSGTAGATVVKYYHAHQTTETVGVFAVAFAVVALTFFLASLRRTLSAADEGRYLANVVTAGGAVYTIGLCRLSAAPPCPSGSAGCPWRSVPWRSQAPRVASPSWSRPRGRS
jgi:apolipoprotein N-acyltransferase